MILADLEKGILDLIIINVTDEIKNDRTMSDEEKLSAALSKAAQFSSMYNVPISGNDERNEYVTEKIRGILGIRDQITVLDDGYQPWLEDRRTEIDWIHRDRYFRYLKDIKQWDPVTVRGQIDITTDIILDHTADPLQKSWFTKKGLVIGDVQSGKTANYIGLINKAFDVGYQLVIVLAGMQNDLRSQTQERLDREVLGYETSLINPMENGDRIGVGMIPGYTADIESMTSRGGTGDYKKKNGVQLFNGAGSKKVAIVKKNTTVLKNLYEDLSSQINLTDGKFMTPVLIIDDETDQASVNTKKDPELDPTKINAHIRNIINLCSKISYVGYTATPFANIYINSSAENENFGKDLFPKDFIICLPKPENYCGVNEFFGDKENMDLSLVELVEDYEEFGSFENEEGVFKPKAGDEIEALAESAKNAIEDFIVASALHRYREQKPVHNGMIFNIAQYRTPASSIRDLIEEYAEDLKNEYFYDREVALNRFSGVYEERFEKTSEHFGRKDDWNEAQKELGNVFELLKVRLLNGDSKDIIDYTGMKQSAIIAVGGNKLSRGITIEGLSVSYYLRDPGAYDTAFQMGRWFGYKKDYLDLCRIYTQREIISSFIHMMDATDELKEEIRIMNSENLTPTSYGLKVKSHPSMQPTSSNKMRAAQKLKISLSGRRTETTRFSIEHKQENIQLVSAFLNMLDRDENVSYESCDDCIPVYRNVSSDMIMHLLRQYQEGKGGLSKVAAARKYISAMTEDGELSDWTVVISSIRTDTRRVMQLGRHTVRKAFRTAMNDNGTEVRVLSNPSDLRYLFKTEGERNVFEVRKGIEDPIAKKHFTKDKGLLVISSVDITGKNGPEDVLNPDNVGLTLWFPLTDNKRAEVSYTVNEVYMRNQYNS